MPLSGGQCEIVLSAFEHLVARQRVAITGRFAVATEAQQIGMQLFQH